MDAKVVVWNMEHQKKAPSNWPQLLRWDEIAGADLYLLCEAVADPPSEVSQALRPIMHGSTTESRCECPPDEGGRAKCDKRRYSTALAAPDGVQPLPFEPARAGTWTAGRVALGGIPVTAIALYGLGDSGYDTYWQSTKAAVDEVLGHVASGGLGDHILIGGDFNILAGQRPLHGGHDVLRSLEDQGFVECLQAGLRCDGHLENRGEVDLIACECGAGSECLHTRTFYSKKEPTKPYQDDYLFASAAMAAMLTDCFAVPVGPASPSDHAPIVATFRVQ